MSAEDQFDQHDRVAFDYCLKSLGEDPEISYKELRRQARREESIGVRRQVWTAARRKLGLASESEPPPPPPRPSFAPPSPPRDDTAPALPAEDGASAPTSAQPTSRREDRPRPAWATPPPSHRRKDTPDPLVSPRPTPSQPSPTFPSPPRAIERSPHLPSAVPPPSDDTLARTQPGVAPSDGGRSAIEWMVGYLKTVNPEATFKEVRQAAEVAGHTAYPATFGRAQAIAGILSDQEASERARVSKPAPPPEGVPGPAAASPSGLATRPKTGAAAEVDPVEGLRNFIAAMSRAERESERFRASLRAMLEVVEQALRD